MRLTESSLHVSRLWKTTITIVWCELRLIDFCKLKLCLFFRAVKKRRQSTARQWRLGWNLGLRGFHPGKTRRHVSPFQNHNDRFLGFKVLPRALTKPTFAMFYVLAKFTKVRVSKFWAIIATLDKLWTPLPLTPPLGRFSTPFESYALNTILLFALCLSKLQFFSCFELFFFREGVRIEPHITFRVVFVRPKPKLNPTTNP